MLESTFTKKFLLDENVRRDLYDFLLSQHKDARFVPKSASDRAIQQISLREKRILVTNDSDFTLCVKEEIFSVVWLRIPQRDAVALTGSFQKFLLECGDCKGKLIVLKPYIWEAFFLSERERGCML